MSRLAEWKIAATILALIAIAACRQADEPNAGYAPNAAESVPVEQDHATVKRNSGVATLPSNGGKTGEIRQPVDNGTEPSPPPPAPSATIPAHYQGRWGRTAADCTSSLPAEGLMTIGDTRIKFYEATATLKERRPAIATSFSGLFAFTGEGERWEKVMTFTRSGDTLVRADKNGSYTYRRCA